MKRDNSLPIPGRELDETQLAAVSGGTQQGDPDMPIDLVHGAHPPYPRP